MASVPTNTGHSIASLGQLANLPAKAPHTYLAMATHFAGGAKYLSSSPENAISTTFLCAQATECALKAYLSRDGDERRLKSQNIRHNLVSLWELASTEGLIVKSPAPQWLVMLGELHNKPYYLRYLSGDHGLTLPPQTLMIDELATLIQKIRNQI